MKAQTKMHALICADVPAAVRTARRLLASFALCGLLYAAVATAEVLELEGTVKAVDAASRSITIVRKTPKGEKVFELEVAKNAGDIGSFEVGDRVSFAYNPDVEVISKIEKGLSEDDAADLKAMEGVWKVTTEHEFGRTLRKEEMRTRNRHVIIKGNDFRTDRVIDGRLGTYEGIINLDSRVKSFDFTGQAPNGSPARWIGTYKIDEDTLTLCYRLNGSGDRDRPTEFKSLSEKPGTILLECRREE